VSEPKAAEPDVTIPSGPALPTRFYGHVDLESIRLGRDASRIAEEVVSHLAKLPDTDVTITLEVEARSPSGFPEDVRRTVSENARTLRFDVQEFEGEGADS
jgi:hypothetical protein